MRMQEAESFYSSKHNILPKLSNTVSLKAEMHLQDPAYVTMRPALGPCIPSALTVWRPRRDPKLGESQARVRYSSLVAYSG